MASVQGWYTNLWSILYFCITMWMCLMLIKYILKLAKMVNFVLCIFYHNIKGGMVLGWFHCRQREQQVPMSCGKREHGWKESQQGWFVKIWRIFYGLRWGQGHRQRKGHRKSGYWYLSWDQWEIVVEPSSGQQQKCVFKNYHGLGGRVGRGTVDVADHLGSVRVLQKRDGSCLN